MGYLQDVDAWLTELLVGLAEHFDVDGAKQKIKDKILESYRNGLRDGELKGGKPRNKPHYDKSGYKKRNSSGAYGDRTRV